MTLKQIIIPILALTFTSCAQQKTQASSVPALEEASLCQKFAPYFRLGVAINVDQSSGNDTVGQEVIKRHFNTIVAENCMKCEKIHPYENEYFWDDADKFVEFGNANDQWIVGHCLIWHSQLAPWFCVDNEGKLVSKEVLKQRMHDHIHTIVERYKGKVHAWDVVNEAVEDNGDMRNSMFYQILGDEYIPYAFECAHESDPDAELYINDFAMNKPGKRDRYVKIVNDLKNRGLRIDGIGMQGHIGMDYPDFKDFEKSIEAYANTGLDVMVTELDMTILPTITHAANVEQNMEYQKSLNPYPESLPTEVDAAWNQRMSDFMKMLIKHSDKITRVNFWGVNDADSWRNDWPVRGRKDYPLIFDRDWNIKPFMADCLEKKS